MHTPQTCETLGCHTPDGAPTTDPHHTCSCTLVLLRCDGAAGSLASSPVGQYLAHYDPDAHSGRGESRWTSDPDEALTFPSAVDALRLWKQPSTATPRRPDGKPNRPLTAYHISTIESTGKGQR